MTAALRPFTRTFVSVFSLLLFLSTVVHTQAGSQLSGRVFDPDGKRVPDTEVVISGSTAAPQRVRTNADGTFAVSGLPAGRYDLRASAPGLVADPVSVTLTDGAASTADITLRVSAINETLIVSAAQIDQPLSRTPDSLG